MQNNEILLTEEDFGAFFARAQKSVFRLEIPTYFAFEEVDFQRYQSTGQLDLVASADWHHTVRNCCIRGVTWTRVKKLVLPLTGYAKFLYKHFWYNQAQGEQIRVVPEAILLSHLQAHSWLRDFWLFDEVEGCFVNYTPDHDFAGFTRLNHTEVAVCTEVRRQLLTASIPMGEIPEILALQPPQGGV